MMMSPYEWNILNKDVKPQTNKLVESKVIFGLRYIIKWIQQVLDLSQALPVQSFNVRSVNRQKNISWGAENKRLE